MSGRGVGGAGAAVALLLLIPILPLKATDLLFFHEPGCPHCARVRDFLAKRIIPEYSVTVRDYDIHHGKNADLLLRLARAYGSDRILREGTPAVFVGNQAVQGGDRRALRDIETAVRASIREGADSPLARLDGMDRERGSGPALTLPAVLAAAAVDAVNPCAAAVLVLLLGTVLLAGNRRRRRVITAGLSFTGACFISYFLLGLGLFSAIRAAGLERAVFTATALLALLLGAWSIRSGSGISSRPAIGVPASWQPALKRLATGVTSAPGAFFTGLVISLFLLPCTSGPYVIIIGMLGRTVSRARAIPLLLLYNTVFVLPFVLITLGVGLGLTTTARVERWRARSLSRGRLWSGMVLLALGLILLILVFTGRV